MNSETQVLPRFRRFLAREESTRALGLVRMGLALQMAIEFTRPTALYDWVDTPLHFLFASSFYLLVPLVFFGVKTRITLPLLALWSMVWAWSWFGWHEGMKPFQRAGTPLVLGLLSFTPAGRSFSLDRLLAVRKAEAAGDSPPPERGPYWGHWVLRLHLSLMYLFAGLDKLDAGWFAGERLQRIFLNHYGSAELFYLHPWLVTLTKVAAVLTTLVELGLAVAIWIPRLRGYAAVVGLGLHWSFWYSLKLWPLTVRMWLMWIVVPRPQAVHDFIDRILGHGAAKVPTPESAAAEDDESSSR